MGTQDVKRIGSEDKYRAYFMEKMRRPTAYHEAGHAVIGWYTGDAQRIELIDLVPKEGSTNWAFTRAYQKKVQFLGSPDRLARAVYCCAGYEAQARVQPRGDKADVEFQVENEALDLPTSDYGTALRVLTHGGFSESEAFQRLYQVRDHTERLVHDPALWQAIEMIAETLLEMPLDSARLEGDRLQSLMGKLGAMTGAASVDPVPRL